MSKIVGLASDHAGFELKQFVIEWLKAKGYKVATKVTKATMFWEAEAYHQDYYERKGTQPYCHSYAKRF